VHEFTPQRREPGSAERCSPWRRRIRIGTGEFASWAAAAGRRKPGSVDSAGRQLISAYALGVVIGAPLLTALLVRRPRKTALIILMGWFATGNILSATAPNFDLALAARFATGLPHGAFFGAGAVVAGSLVPPARRTAPWR